MQEDRLFESSVRSKMLTFESIASYHRMQSHQHRKQLELEIFLESYFSHLMLFTHVSQAVVRFPQFSFQILKSTRSLLKLSNSPSLDISANQEDLIWNVTRLRVNQEGNKYFWECTAKSQISRAKLSQHHHEKTFLKPILLKYTSKSPYAIR